MFNAYEFTFAGQSSTAYGVVVCDFDGHTQDDSAFGNKASIVEAQTTGRIRPIHYGVNYNKKPLEFKLVFGSEMPLDRFDMERVALWLTGHQDYQWLSIAQPDLEHVRYRCLITDLEMISVGWLPYAFEATVRCDSPYAYGYSFNNRYAMDGHTSVTFKNGSSIREYLRPDLIISLNPGESEFKIVNRSDGDREFSFSGLPTLGIEISVDNENGIITELTASGANLYQFCNLNFFRLVDGDNDLEITGNGHVSISGRFLHNIAG